MGKFVCLICSKEITKKSIMAFHLMEAHGESDPAYYHELEENSDLNENEVTFENIFR